MNPDTQLQLPFSSLETNYNSRYVKYIEFQDYCIDTWYQASVDAMQEPFQSEEEYHDWLEAQAEDQYFDFLDTLDTSTPPNSYAAEPPRSTS